MSQDKFPIRIRYEYKVETGVAPRNAHGVWGGINAQGEVEINFYTESDKLPRYSERIVAPDGSFGHEMAPFDENLRVISRHVHAKILVNYQTAKDILEWLEEKVEMLETEGDNAFSLDGDDRGNREQ